MGPMGSQTPPSKMEKRYCRSIKEMDPETKKKIIEEVINYGIYNTTDAKQITTIGFIRFLVLERMIPVEKLAGFCEWDIKMMIMRRCCAKLRCKKGRELIRGVKEPTPMFRKFLLAIPPQPGLVTRRDANRTGPERTQGLLQEVIDEALVKVEIAKEDQEEEENTSNGEYTSSSCGGDELIEYEGDGESPAGAQEFPHETVDVDEELIEVEVVAEVVDSTDHVSQSGEFIPCKNTDKEEEKVVEEDADKDNGEPAEECSESNYSLSESEPEPERRKRGTKRRRKENKSADLSKVYIIMEEVVGMLHNIDRRLQELEEEIFD